MWGGTRVAGTLRQNQVHWLFHKRPLKRGQVHLLQDWPDQGLHSKKRMWIAYYQTPMEQTKIGDCSRFQKHFIAAILWHLQICSGGLKEYCTVLHKETSNIDLQGTMQHPLTTHTSKPSLHWWEKQRAKRCLCLSRQCFLIYTAHSGTMHPCPTNLFCWRQPTQSVTQGVGAMEPRGPVWDSQQLRQVFLSKCAKYQSREEARG